MLEGRREAQQEQVCACQHKLPKTDSPITFEVLNLQDKEFYIWNLHKIIFVVNNFSGLEKYILPNQIADLNCITMATVTFVDEVNNNY